MLVDPLNRQSYYLFDYFGEADKTPMVLENWKVWLTIPSALILDAYTVPLMEMFQNGPPPSKDFRVW
jgi:cytochrome c oxidase subunit I